MAGSRPDIAAGRAYVSLYVKKSAFVTGLKNAQAMFASFGQRMLTAGAGIGAAGTAMLGPLAAAATVFAGTASALRKMSLQTGESAANLSALQYAASQSSVEFDDVLGSIEELNIRLGETIRDGTGPAAEAFKNLSLDAQQLAKMSPVERLQAVGEQLANIQSESQRGFLADEIFGGDAFKILPMLRDGANGLRAMMNEARELGVVMSDEDAKAASELSSAIGKVHAVLTAVAQQIGAAVAPMFVSLAESLAKSSSVAIQFIKANRPLVNLAVKIGVGLLAAGTAISAIGLAFTGAAVVVGGFLSAIAGVSTIIGVIGGAIAFIVSPLGILTAGLLAAGIAFFGFTETGRTALAGLLQSVSSILGSMSSTFSTTMDGIWNSLMSGDWATAGQIMMTGIRLAVLQGVTAISELIGGLFGGAIATIAGQIASGDIAGAFATVALGLQSIWETFTSGIVSMFANAAKSVVDTWKKTVDAITGYILQKASEGGMFGKAFEMYSGVDLAKEKEREAQIKKRMEEMGLNTGGESLFDQINSGTYEDPASTATADAINAQLEAAKEAQKQRAAMASTGFATNVAAGVDNTASDVERLQQELLALQQSAKASREQADAEAVDSTPKGTGPTGSKSSAATFSSAAAIAFGQGAGPAAQQLQVLKETKRGIDKNNEHAANMIVAIKSLGLYHA